MAAKDFTSQAGVFLQAEATKKKTAAKKAKTPEPDTVPAGYVLKPEPKSKRLNLLIRPSIYEGLKDKAQAAGQSVNDYLNDLIAKDISK